jgi:RNA polymerase sigma-70 factor, ECF subfamily
VIPEREFAELLSAARSGDDAAMRTLFRDLHPRLVRFLRASEPGAADDLAGEVWLAVATGLGRFEGTAIGFRAWVFSIARRRIADHRRRGVRRNTQPAEDKVLEQVQGLDDVEASALDRLSGRTAAELVVAHLPAHQAEVILLRVLADLDVDTVAEVMGKSANWVRVTQHRALRRLSDRLGPRLDVMR